MAIIDTYLTYLLEVSGTDLLLAAGARPLMRVNGRLQVMKRRYVAASDVEYHAQEVLGPERAARLPEVKSIDCVYEASINGVDRRFRGAVYYQRNGLNILLRCLPSCPATAAELGLGDTVKTLGTIDTGLVIVAGPARSGKSSTLSALVEHINDTQPVHIVTLEDPIETVYGSRQALISQRQIGLHADSFESGMASALREDPDVIMVSDLRDLATIRLVLQAVESGFLVLAGMQAGTALRCIEQLIQAFPADHQAAARTLIARSVRAVQAQELVPRADNSGCVPASDLLLVTPHVESLIRIGATSELIDTMRKRTDGMRLLEDDLTSLVAAGTIHEDDAYSRIEACELARVGGV